MATHKARHFVAGLGSGVTSAIILQPLDLLKTRVQQADHRGLVSQLKIIAASPGKIRAFWRGTVPSALRTGFGSALYFTSLNAIRQHVSRAGLSGNARSAASDLQLPSSSSSILPRVTASANLLAGATARTFAGFVLMPLTVIKVRYESSLYSYRSIMDASRDIFASHGIKGFFSGLGATAVRDAPYAGMYVLFYEALKMQLSNTSKPPGGDSAGRTALAPLGMSQAGVINFSSGMLAGAACSVISNPFDAIKTRIQLQPSSYPNMYRAFIRMVQQEGIKSLFDGLALRMSRKALSSALAWTVYEELMRRAEQTWGAKMEETAQP